MITTQTCTPPALLLKDLIGVSTPPRVVDTPLDGHGTQDHLAGAPGKDPTMLGLGIIGWIIIGGLAGWIGSKIMKTDAQMGILLNIVVGIAGGLLGGFLLKLLGVDVEGGGLIFSFLTCLLGAVILLFIVKAVTGRRVHH
ncbi:possible transglycosylase (plasmid) [Rhodococcus jostii RHA1]|uniref:Possible transglycosylase n=3 Tax=Nocardiaceae TaxID=85025 RepID=Q0RY61_RHOJR|nr:possible transglycosylase [Rhodococcus jostii RHA1]